MRFPERSKILITLIGLVLIGAIAAAAHGQESKKIVGSVVDQLSTPIPNAHITLYSLDRILKTTSDSSGHFHFDGVLPTNYEIEVLAQGFKRFIKTVDLSDGKPIVMEIASTGSPVVMVTSVMEVAPTGSCGPPYSIVYDPRKTPDAAPLSGNAIEQYATRGVEAATVKLVDPIGVQIARRQTDKNGEFQFRIPPGRYHIVTTHSGYDDITTGEFWVARENTTHITLRPVPTGKIMRCQY